MAQQTSGPPIDGLAKRGDFVVAHPEIQELARQWISHESPLSEAGFRPLFPLVEKLLRAALAKEGEASEGATLIPMLQRCCSDRLRFFNIPGMCCDARARDWISTMRAAVIHGEYSKDMAELQAGSWVGTEADYQKVLPNRLYSFFYYLDNIVKQVDPQTGRFRRTWEPGRSLCASCKAKGLTI
jgi:hypothetical protein